MKCYQHIDCEAVAMCQVCQKGLCGECSSLVEGTICMPCAIARNKEVERGIKIRVFGTAICLILPILGFFVEVVSGRPANLFDFMKFGAISVLFYWGLSFYKNMPFYPILISGRGFFVTLLILLFAAPFIGLFYAPFRFFKMYIEIKRIRELEKVNKFPNSKEIIAENGSGEPNNKISLN